MTLLYKETRSYGRGCPEDESESWTSTSIFLLIEEENEEAYLESIASDYGDQDYSYRFISRLICSFYSEELEALKLCLERKLVIESRRY